jgi:opacity protein-like surface antigen
MNKNITLVFSLAALAPLGAQAEITYYGGFGAGGSRVEEDLNLTFSAFEYLGEDLIPVFDRSGNPDINPRYGQAVSSRLDKFNGTDLGYRVFAGVRFGRYIGIEAGYVNLAKPEDEIELNIPNKSGPSDDVILCDECRPETDLLLTLEDNFYGWDLYVLGALPITDRWEAFAKIGAISWESKFTAKNGFADTFPPSPPGSWFIPTTTPESFQVKTDGTDLAGGLGFDYKVTDRLTLRGEGTWYDIEDTEQVWLLGLNIIIAL